VVVEAGSANITAEAEEILIRQGIEIVPDLMCGAAAEVAGALEWRAARQDVSMRRDAVDDHIRKRLSLAVRRVRVARARHEREYQFVYTPHLANANLFATSGHLDFYKDGMYPPMEMDNGVYYPKPMNCPMHCLIFRSRQRSYRELPLRLFELGTVYRYERAGTLHGLCEFVVSRRMTATSIARKTNCKLKSSRCWTSS
jgi:hypothetical protein